ncbi:MAG: hypothetical protein GY869_18710 [Planctomycetes bacterium]|nr:hypothetical protein [Planctomycetota bacterium]
MNIYYRTISAAIIYLFIVGFYGCSPKPEVVVQPMSQYPSPMAESIRVHERIKNESIPGVSLTLENVLPRPIEIYVPDQALDVNQVDILIHFHGMSYVPRNAVYHSGHPLILAVVNLGAGSSVYQNAFQEQTTFPNLIDSIMNTVSQQSSIEINPNLIYLSGFSAGYGSVRAILRDHQSLVDGVILLDGLHTGYVPPRQVLAEGGAVDQNQMIHFVDFARLAQDGKKRFFITHSEIFPGTYASTTETTNYIIDALDLTRHPVIRWGPVGMQLLSETEVNGLTILGFAGNSAPDHIDHFHGLPIFLKMFLEQK